MKRTGFTFKPRTPLKRTRIRILGKSDSAEDKREIQRLVREIVMIRDKGCILQKYRHCNDPVKQADHLISRSHSATFADTRLIVCLCRSCHAWKSLGSNLRKGEYDRLVKTILPKSRVQLWERMEAESWRATKMDWKLAIVALKQELDELKFNHKGYR